MLEIRALEPEELDPAVALVLRVFEEFVRPDLSDAGWAKLLEYIDPEAARARAAEHVMLAALEGGLLVGVLEIRQARHISLLAVERASLGRGIARSLLGRCIEICRETNPELDRLTVHSSRHAIEAYRRLGFEALGEEMVMDGVLFTPMARSM